MAERGEQRRVWIDVAALVLLSAVVRAGYAWAVPRMLDSADAVHYIETARAFARGDFLTVDPKIPALYPALAALAGLFGPDVETSGQFVSFLFSTLLVVPVFYLSRQLHGEGVARIAGALVALWPWLVDYSNRVATEPTAVFFWVLGALCLVRGLDRGGRAGWMAGAAISFVALHLARAEGTFVLIAALGAIAARGGRGEWRPMTRNLAVYSAAAGVLLSLHAIYLHALAGRWTLNYRVAFIGERPEGSSVMVELGRTLVAMTSDVPAVMLGPLLWAFAGAGLIVPRARPADSVRAEMIILYLAAVQWLVVIPVLSPAPRYLMAAFVALTLWSARGIGIAGDAIAARTARRWTRLLPPLLVVAWMVMHLCVAVVRERWEGGGLPPQPWEYRIAGGWMREHLDAGLVVTRKPQVGFYAEMPTFGVPAGATLGEILTGATSAGARYLVVDERYTAVLVPALAPLLDPGAAPPTLRPIRADLSPYPKGRVVIYEFVRGP